ncbi:MAG TPA: TIGR03086 family metal-binding protein [Mycobacterium sp.]|nr:TIGR03086 family metal-binding protein [Mycobacterium sp.]
MLITSGLDPLHRLAVLKSIEIVNTVEPAQFDLPTPCGGWTVLDLLTHMTVQHRGFAAAARGFGADPQIWQVATVTEAVRSDPRGAYAKAAQDVLEAFAVQGSAETLFALPEFGDGAEFPGAMAMAFHFVDYVVHGWDFAASLGISYELPTAVVKAVLPLVLAVPDGDFRSIAGAPFAPALEGTGDDDFDRILRHLGRDPGWRQRYSTVTGAWSDQRRA